MIRHKIVLLYSWFIHLVMFCLPDIPLLMRFRGFFYGIAMKHCGRNVQIAHSVILNTLEMMSMADNVYIANYTQLLANGEISIGENSLIGPNVVISSGNHIMKDGVLLKTSEARDVKIGRNCWIAANCTIVGGGGGLPNSSILAAGAVWTAHVAELTEGGIYGGVPARIVKKRCC